MGAEHSLHLPFGKPHLPFGKPRVADGGERGGGGGGRVKAAVGGVNGWNTGSYSPFWGMLRRQIGNGITLPLQGTGCTRG